MPTPITGDVPYTAQYTKKAHEYKPDVWKYDDSGHWQVCTVLDCGYAAEKAPTPTPMRMPRSARSAVHPALCRS